MEKGKEKRVLRCVRLEKDPDGMKERSLLDICHYIVVEEFKS